ncbi:MAG: glycoside hydrolase family 38 C-terminal domain-containing protein [Bacteroidota bacterium]|nr:glycoside hydrolase family 38 C-terminal domain-containing protein [Bacteroidota bacterium]
MIQKYFLILICLVIPVNLAAQNKGGNPYNYLSGYDSYIHGEKFSYHSAHPGVNECMLVRSMQEELYIEWLTEKVPGDYPGGPATFILLAAMNVRENDKHSWDILINGKERESISTPGSREMEEIRWEGDSGYSMRFKPVMEDQYGDLHGYILLTVPEEGYTRGQPLNIKAVGESSGDRAFLIIYRHKTEPVIKIVPEQAIRKEGDKAYQLVSVNYTYLGDPVDVIISAGASTMGKRLDFGYNHILVRLPVVEEDRPFDVSIKLGGEILASNSFTLHPVVYREIHLLHHSHVDIGYTHVQDEVKRIQWEHLEDAIKIAERTSDYPEAARFRWNTEVMWALESYLDEKSPGEVIKMIDAIKRGWIEPGAMYAHELTELCNTEELIQVTAAARRISDLTGKEIVSAMITDVPGWSWGLVPVLARSGVKYLSLGTNHGHRIGTIIEKWGDRPFWWVSASGEEKVLAWIHEEGYSLFHTGLNAEKMGVTGISDKLFAYLNKLYERGYPYEIVPLRYSVGADNGPADPSLPDMVKEWNKNFQSPGLRISTVSETFEEFALRYGHLLPSVSGAFTGYWEDGAASSARMTALNRQNAGNANIVNSLAVLKHYDEDISDRTYELWRKILLYDEHTWGAHNSISEPESDFVLQQWAVKRSFARDAATQARKLKDDILDINSRWRDNTGRDKNTLTGVEVINTHSWPVTSVIEMQASWNPAGTKVRDEDGNILPSQQVSTGHFYFIARDVPPLGSKIYYFSGEENVKTKTPGQSNTIQNDLFILKVNESDGSIESLVDRRKNIELVDNSELPGLNSYFYVEGRSPEIRHRPSEVKVEVMEEGELLSVIKTEGEAPGCMSITNYYTLVKGIDKVYITTVIDKKKIYDKEGVHLGFPFNIPGGDIHIDLALGVYEPDAGQAEGACKNYFTPERWIDISNQDKGVTYISLDAPLIEIGDISTDAIAYGWVSDTPESQTIYSYIMNNYWETNYRAGQEGKITFRYVLHPHGMFNSAISEKSAIEEAERLVLLPESNAERGMEPLFRITNDNIICTGLVPAEDGYLIRLYNAGGAPEKLNINFRDEPAEVWISGFDGEIESSYKNGMMVPGFGVRTIKVIARCEMRDARCEMRDARCEMRIAKCEMRNARCEMRDAK